MVNPSSSRLSFGAPGRQADSLHGHPCSGRLMSSQPDGRDVDELCARSNRRGIQKSVRRCRAQPAERHGAAVSRCWVSTLSPIGSVHLSQLTYPLVMLALTGSPALAGSLSAVRDLPLLMVGLPAGALVDRCVTPNTRTPAWEPPAQDRRGSGPRGGPAPDSALHQRGHNGEPHLLSPARIPRIRRVFFIKTLTSRSGPCGMSPETRGRQRPNPP
jgi:hypothetical protein